MAESTETKTFSSITSAGVASDRNAKHRRFMEDAHTIVDKFNNDESQGFFAVYDGHGGKSAALFCQDNFHKILQEELSKSENLDDDETMIKIFNQTYSRTDEVMKPTIPSAGACAVTALVRKKASGQRVLYCANAGDSRGVLCRSGQAECLSVDHKASSESEAQRIIAAGGFVKNERVNGMIAVSRALGDHNMKAYITSEPHITATELQPKDSFLILACDGVWDVLPIQTAVDLVVNDTDPTEMARKILRTSIQTGSTDNITVLVVLL